jgi:hypothetical protein
VQSGSGSTGLYLGDTNSPSISVASDNTTPGQILLRQNLVVDSSLTHGTATLLNSGNGSLHGQLNLDGGSPTFDVHDGTSSIDLDVSLAIRNGSFTKSGAGSLRISSGQNNFSSTTLIGGTLLLGGSNVLPDNANLTLSGGNLSTGGYSDSLNALSLTSNGIINMGSGSGSEITFASAGAWSGILSVWNYTGAPWTNGSDKLIFSNPSGVNLTQVQFYSDEGTTLIGTGGAGFIGNELVPVPEPTAFATALLLLISVGYRERKSWLHYRQTSQV